MKLHIISDIHLEFGDLELPGGETLIVAGDMCEARSFGANHDGTSRQIAKDIKRFVDEEFAKYKNVFFVPGNHEYYGRSIEETHKLLKLNLPSSVHILQDNGFRFPDWKRWFYGTTLWTDVGGDSPQGHHHLKHSMSDFSVIEEFSTHRMFMLNKDYKEGLRWFLHLTQKGHDNHSPVIIITHHAPSVLSVHEKYKNDIYMNMGYHNNLDELILSNPQIKLWIHGHMHNPSDYNIGDTRIVCNPRGYYGYEHKNKDYIPLEIEI